MFVRNTELDRFEVAKIIENFLQSSAGPWDWDHFTQGMHFRDSALEAIRQRCANLSKEFPPDSSVSYCGEEGLKVLQAYVSELRKTR